MGTSGCPEAFSTFSPCSCVLFSREREPNKRSGDGRAQALAQALPRAVRGRPARRRGPPVTTGRPRAPSCEGIPPSPRVTETSRCRLQLCSVTTSVTHGWRNDCGGRATTRHRARVRVRPEVGSQARAALRGWRQSRPLPTGSVGLRQGPAPAPRNRHSALGPARSYALSPHVSEIMRHLSFCLTHFTQSSSLSTLWRMAGLRPVLCLTRVCACVHACVHVWVRACARVPARVRVHTCMRVRVCPARVHVCVHVRVRACVLRACACVHRIGVIPSSADGRARCVHELRP